MKSIYVVLMMGIFAEFSSFAEFRIWEDRSGRIWEGEFVTMNAGKVVVQNQSGTKTEYNPEQLSENDLSYLEEIIPPKLSLDVSKTSNSSTSGNSESIICRASIKKANTRIYKGELTAVLVVLAEEMRTGAFSKAGASTEYSFVLPEKHGVVVEFESSAVPLAKSSAKSGRVYAGYVLVVWDRFGNPVAVQSNRDSFLERATKIARPRRR
ncbi:SHD1 domain-containing protein [Pontiella agarivorans]|uniref:SHD1 domain-containing protein n=1 Tax=Pontiella agarivorans TaxID=3038953 RepID=A0ABU5MZE4_9BACT|nr:SHD1 domain-containing protein [Pontiella agarivorans]MDZ8119534.1 SHD1 domain-containing protein [Pontiella agarivorans]